MRLSGNRDKDSVERIVRRFDSLRYDILETTEHQVVVHLHDENGDQPVANFYLIAKDADTDRVLNTVVSNRNGTLTIRYLSLDGFPIRKLKIRIFRPDDDIATDEPLHEQVLDVTSPLDTPVEVKLAGAVQEEFSAPIRRLIDKKVVNLTPRVQELLAAKKVETLADLQLQPVADPDDSDDEDDRKALADLQALARLEPVTSDETVSRQLVDRGYQSVEQIASQPRARFVDQMHDVLGDMGAARIHVEAQTRQALMNNLATGEYIERALYATSETRGDQDDPCRCEDCESAVSPGAYLTDLVRYTVQNVNNDSTDIDLAFLENAFHQPLGELQIDCEAVTAEVLQVRIAVEVLIAYLQKANKQPLIDQAVSSYLSKVYNALLEQIGTSYEELVLAHAADHDKREDLALRLGIDDPAHLEELRLEKNSFAGWDLEADWKLQRLFGLRSVNRPPLSPITTTPDYLTWRMNHLRPQLGRRRLGTR